MSMTENKMKNTITNKKNVKMNKTKISPPWIVYARKIKALFENDPAVTVHNIDEDTLTLHIDVEGEQKYEAMRALLPEKKTFGNVTLTIDIEDVTELGLTANDYFYLLSRLFDGNTSASHVYKAADPTGMEHIFVMFNPDVKQFYDDNLFDYNGFWTGIVQNIAEDVLGDEVDPIVHFCTVDIHEN